MNYHLSFLETCDGPVAIVHARPHDLADADEADRACRRLSRALGDLPVVARCAEGNALLFGGPMHLRRHAADPTVDALPIIEVTIRRRGEAAA
jgi:hypothetical protein